MNALIPLMTASEVKAYFDRTDLQGYWTDHLLLDQLSLLAAEDAEAQGIVRKLIDSHIAGEADVPAAKRGSLDRALRDLVLMLPPSDRVPFASEFVLHRRKSRREAGYRISATLSAPEVRTALLASFELRGDLQALVTLARASGYKISDIARQLLVAFEELYDQARVFQKLVIEDLAQAIELSNDYPLAFLWGAGRSAEARALPAILRMVEEQLRIFEQIPAEVPDWPAWERLQEVYRCIDLGVWALGKIGARDELLRLAAVSGVDVW